MTTERFTLKQFEDALPCHKISALPLWQPMGMVGGEYTYRLVIDGQTAIEIRSSVDSSGYAADTGQDSIRAWLVDCDGNPLGSKVSRWVTRVPGWADRLKSTLRTLWQWRKNAGNCPTCNQPKQIFKVKKAGPNKGRVFAKCDEHNGFVWLED